MARRITELWYNHQNPELPSISSFPLCPCPHPSSLCSPSFSASLLLHPPSPLHFSPRNHVWGIITAIALLRRLRQWLRLIMRALRLRQGRETVRGTTTPIPPHTYVVVPDRNQILFHQVFRVHHRVCAELPLRVGLICAM